MIRLVAEFLVRLRLGAPRPCGDDECVADSPEQHGIPSQIYPPY